MDGRLSERLNIFGRYSFAQVRPATAPRPSARAAARARRRLGGFSKVKNQSLALGLDYTLSPTSILDFRFGWFNYKVDVLPFDFGTTPAPDAGIPGLNFDDIQLRALRRVNIEGNQDRRQLRLRPRRQPLQLPAGPGREAVADRRRTSPRSSATTRSSPASTSGAPTTCACPATPTARASWPSTRNRTIGPNGGGLGLASSCSAT